jgi:SAM-dependent methyltransferase
MTIPTQPDRRDSARARVQSHTLRWTAERHVPDAARSDADVAMDVRHRYAYSLVGEFAEPHFRLLDIGSGEGYGAAVVSDFVATYQGVDVSGEAVTHARRRYARATIRFDQYAGGTLPYPDDAFDLITSFQVIEHVDDVETYLAEMHRVGCTGAVVLITTPNRKLRLRDGEKPWNRFHVREYDAGGLRTTLEGHFSSVDMFGVRGSESMEALERARLARARRVSRWDVLGLRYLLPTTLDRALRSVVRSRRGAGAQFSIDGMWRTADELDRALDLLAVARC